jgi:hypothetical protein
MVVVNRHARLSMFIRSRTAAALVLLSATLAVHAQTTLQATPDTSSAPEQLTPAQKARLAPRRPTRQIVGSPLPIVTEGYRPTLTPRENASGMRDPAGTLPIHPAPAGTASPVLAPMPVPVTGCAAGGCIGADGVRYNTGASGVTVDPAGRTCHQVGTTVQCF